LRVLKTDEDLVFAMCFVDIHTAVCSTAHQIQFHFSALLSTASLTAIIIIIIIIIM